MPDKKPSARSTLQWPKLSLEFDLKDFRLVESFYDPGPDKRKMFDPPGPYLRSNKNSRSQKHNAKSFEWEPGQEPNGDKAFVFLFVRAKRWQMMGGIDPDNNWELLHAVNGSAAFKLAGIREAYDEPGTKETKGTQKDWIRDFCGYDRRKCSLAWFLNARHYKAAKKDPTQSVTIKFDALAFPPENIHIKVWDGKRSREVTTLEEVLKIERALHELKDWGDARDLETPPKPEADTIEAEAEPAQPPPPDRKSLAPYRRHIAQQFGQMSEASLRFLGGPLGDNRKIGPPRLAEVYITLDAQWKPASPENTVESPDHPASELAEAGARLHRAESHLLPAVQLLAEHPRLVLLGLPGAGKSTFVKHVSVCLAQHALEPKGKWLARLSVPSPDSPRAKPAFAWPETLSHLAPVFIELRKFNDELVASPPKTDAADTDRLREYIRRQIRQAAGPIGEAAVEQAICDGHALLIFDGLDEVPEDTFKTFLRNTISKLAETVHPHTRFVVTCRSVSYQDEAWRLPKFEQAELHMLGKTQRQLFVKKFYDELVVCGRIPKDTAAQRAPSLISAIESRDELQEMAGNPYLLSMMSQLHFRTRLPDKRAEVFEEFVEELLRNMEEEKRRDDKAPPISLKSLVETAGSSLDAFREQLSHLAFLAHRAAQSRTPPAGEASVATAFISKKELTDALETLPAKKHSRSTREKWSADVLRLIKERGGLLQEQTTDLYSIAFKLQEFMAAAHLTHHYELAKTHPKNPLFECAAADLIQDDSGYWEEVVMLAAGIQAHVRKSPHAAHALAQQLCKAGVSNDAARVRRAKLAGEILRDTGLNDVQRSAQGSDCLSLVRSTLSGLSVEKTLPIKRRSEAASAFGWLEDLPPGAGLGEDGMPQFVWCGPSGLQALGAPLDFERAFPAKPFPMGGDPEAYGSFKEPFECTRIQAPFFLSQFPVTVAQYHVFVEQGGYGEPNTKAKRPDWWTDEGWRWRNGGLMREEMPDYVRDWYAKLTFPILRPADFDAVFQTPNHPRVGVCWHEAAAFCAWLTMRLRALPSGKDGVSLPRLLPGDTIRLPTDAEWERAARSGPAGTVDGRVFPWGDPRPNEKLEDHLTQRCNWGGTGLKHTSAVGLFADGRSACGAADLAGNVWEWCHSKWKPLGTSAEQKEYNGDKAMDAESVAANEECVLRGGSWDVDFPACLRAASRFNLHPGYRYDDVGFRVVLVGASR